MTEQIPLTSNHVELTAWTFPLLLSNKSGIPSACCAEPTTACYGLWCCPCAFASLRTKYDGSSWWFNLCCVLSPVVRNVIREGYKITGSTSDDIYFSYCCWPCVYAQAAMEIDLPHRRQQSRIQSEGSAQWTWGLLSCECTKSCLYAYTCHACAAADVRSSFDGSDFCFNCCCVGLPLINNIIRMAYGINGSTCNDMVTATFCPCCTVHRLQREVRARGPRGKLIVGHIASVEPLMGTVVQPSANIPAMTSPPSYNT